MLAAAILALVPYILITTAHLLYSPQVARDIGARAVTLEVISGLATAGCAFGALAGGDLIQRFRRRNLFLLFEALFAGGALANAAAGSVVGYGFSRIASGFATGVLLVTALPRRWGCGERELAANPDLQENDTKIQGLASCQSDTDL